jgi:hypothetical protein
MVPSAIGAARMLSPELQLIAIIVGPAGLTGLIIAWMGHRNQRAKPATLPMEAMVPIAQNLGSHIALDELSLHIKQLCFSLDRNTIATNDLLAEIRQKSARPG